MSFFTFFVFYILVCVHVCDPLEPEATLMHGEPTESGTNTHS